MHKREIPLPMQKYLLVLYMEIFNSFISARIYIYLWLYTNTYITTVCVYEPILHPFTYFAYNFQSMQVILPFHCARTKVCNGNGNGDGHSSIYKAKWEKKQRQQVMPTKNIVSAASVSQSLSHFAHFLRHSHNWNFAKAKYKK